MKLYLRITVLIGLTMVLARCKEEQAIQEHLTQGIIKYDVSYPELTEDNLMLEMLPDEMTMTFKEDRFKSQLKTGAGIVEMTVIANSENRQLHNMVKLFSDRYVLSLDEEGAKNMVNVIPPFQMKHLEGIDTVAQAPCKRVLIDFGAAKNESYVFCFTDLIAMKSPNWCTPYSDIEGVLLDYHIENYGVIMHLKAREIISQEVDDAEFEVDDRYVALNKEEFDDLVVKNMKIFME